MKDYEIMAIFAGSILIAKAKEFQTYRGKTLAILGGIGLATIPLWSKK